MRKVAFGAFDAKVNFGAKLHLVQNVQMCKTVTHIPIYRRIKMLVNVSDACVLLKNEVKAKRLKDVPLLDKVDAAVRFAAVKNCNSDAVRRINTDIRIYKAILNIFCKKTKF